MCQITAPPTVFLAGPLQALGWWLVIAGVLAFFLWAVQYTYREHLRQHLSALYRRVGLALLTGALLLVWSGMVLGALVVVPSTNALGAWSISQFDILDTSHCPDTAYAPLNVTYNHQLNGPIATWQFVACVLMFVGFGVGVIWRYWLSRRTLAQPARQ